MGGALFRGSYGLNTVDTILLTSAMWGELLAFGIQIRDFGHIHTAQIRLQKNSEKHAQQSENFCPLVFMFEESELDGSGGSVCRERADTCGG